MGPRASTLLTPIVAVVVGIGTYHVLVSRPDSSTGPVSGAESTATPPPALAVPPTAGSPAPATPAEWERRVAALQSRLEALEARLIPQSVEAGARALGHLPAGVGERRETWTDEQIASLRAMMDEVEVRRSMDRETSSYRDLVRRVAPNLSTADESASVSLVANFMRSIRGLFAGASAGTTEDERIATNAKASAERTKLLKDLSAFLSKDVVDRIAPHLPDFANPVGHTPPNRESPVVPSPMDR